ncbi:MAG TPA: prepilin-type N-terminal cleavage/methylation domain-containing protein [Vicinamibacterales bacterium]|jgi:general secretion pathway protein G
MIATKDGAPPASRRIRSSRTGFTLLELLLVVGLLGTLAAISIPTYFRALERARVTRAIGDIKNISLTISVRMVQTGTYPDSLADAGFADLLDPWGHSYQYLKLFGTKNRGGARKDKNLVPLNDDFDLYSMGKDGASAGPLTAKASRDDVVRANSGGFIGLAADY